MPSLCAAVEVRASLLMRPVAQQVARLHDTQEAARSNRAGATLEDPLLAALVCTTWLTTPGWPGYSKGKAASDDGQPQAAADR